MAGIPREIIDELRSRVDIAELIQAYVPLKKNGQDFIACCPFHQEKTPSFRVNVKYQHYHCFGCGKNGNIFSFVMEHENVDFPTAVRIIAQRYGVIIPEEDHRPRSRRQYPSEDTAQEKGSGKDRLYELLDMISKWYVRCLENNPSSPVAQYLQSRKLSPESITRFGLGASMDSYDACMTYAHSKGYTDRELQDAGLMKITDDRPPKKYDMFRNRLMFPICDAMGRVVGFSARTIESDPKMMKYVNTPETPVFKKGKLLYGLHLARPEMAEGKKNCAILCEGQLDVIAMHAAGFTNAVAAEGTAFTQEQARILKPSTGTVLLALDSDSAGQNAVFKDARILLPLGFQVKVVTFPGGKDPDELLKNAGKTAIEEAVSSARDFFDFALSVSVEKNGSDPAGKAKSATELLEFIALMENEAGQGAYLAWLAEQLHLLPENLNGQLERIREKNAMLEERYRAYETERNPQENSPQSPAGEQEDYLHKALFEALEIALSNQNAVRLAEEGIPAELRDGSALFTALDQVIQCTMLDEWENARTQIFESLKNVTDMESSLSELLLKESEPMPDSRALPSMQECIYVIRKAFFDREISFRMQKFSALDPSDPERGKIMQEIGELTLERSHLRRHV